LRGKKKLKGKEEGILENPILKRFLEIQKEKPSQRASPGTKKEENVEYSKKEVGKKKKGTTSGEGAGIFSGGGKVGTPRLISKKKKEHQAQKGRDDGAGP